MTIVQVLEKDLKSVVSVVFSQLQNLLSSQNGNCKWHKILRDASTMSSPNLTRLVHLLQLQSMAILLFLDNTRSEGSDKKITLTKKVITNTKLSIRMCLIIKTEKKLWWWWLWWYWALWWRWKWWGQQWKSSDDKEDHDDYEEVEEELLHGVIEMDAEEDDLSQRSFLNSLISKCSV